MASTIFEPLRHCWTVAEYHRLAETGLLDPAARVELVEGELIDMPPIGSLHGGAVNRSVNFLAVALAGKAIVASQDGAAFEVEFVTGEGTTVHVLTLTQADIRPMHEKEILHVRELGLV